MLYTYNIKRLCINNFHSIFNLYIIMHGGNKMKKSHLYYMWCNKNFTIDVEKIKNEIEEQENIHKLYIITKVKEILNTYECDEHLINIFTNYSKFSYLENICTSINKAPKLHSYNKQGIKSYCSKGLTRWIADDANIKNNIINLKYYTPILTKLDFDSIDIKILIFEIEYKPNKNSMCGLYIEDINNSSYEYIKMEKDEANNFRENVISKSINIWEENKQYDKLIIPELCQNTFDCVQKLNVYNRYKKEYSKRYFRITMKELEEYVCELWHLNSNLYACMNITDNINKKKIYGRKVIDIVTLIQETNNLKYYIVKVERYKKEYEEYWIENENVVLIFSLYDCDKKVKFDSCYINGTQIYDL